MRRLKIVSVRSIGHLKVLCAALLCLTLLAACAGPEASDREESPMGPRILSAFHGLDALPGLVSLICPPEAAGSDGLPVVFSVQIDQSSVSESAFAVETADGVQVTPICATLAPAIEPLELRTVLLAGDFGSAEAPPRAVEVVGALLDVGGTSLEGIRIDEVSPLDEGPTLVLAERFHPETSGLAGECPDETRQVIQLTWNGGVHGYPGHLPLGEPQRLGVIVTLADGADITPIALADDDPDNHVHVCLDVETPVQSVTIAADLFEDPGGDPNPETRVNVRP